MNKSINSVNFSGYTLNIKGLKHVEITVDSDALIFKTGAGYACIELDDNQMKSLKKKLEQELKVRNEVLK